MLQYQLVQGSAQAIELRLVVERALRLMSRLVVLVTALVLAACASVPAPEQRRQHA